MNSYALQNLAGLDKLQLISGSLDISYNIASFTSIQGLNALGSIGKNLFIESNVIVKSEEFEGTRKIIIQK